MDFFEIQFFVRQIIVVKHSPQHVAFSLYYSKEILKKKRKKMEIFMFSDEVDDNNECVTKNRLILKIKIKGEKRASLLFID